MFNSLFRSFYFIFILIFIFIIFISCFFVPIIVSNNSILSSENIFFTDIRSSGYLWPTPGYKTINSYFGKRNSPTAGATSYHKGIDIGAPEGSELIAICNGKITFTGFLGGGGYTITLAVNNIKITYCHVSPNYIVKKDDIVTQGTVIGHVGPKNVYGVIGNQYFDENGNPTNGATTGPHLHLGIRVNGNYIDPLTLLN